mgnify:CR=1 FL=1
MVSTPNMWTEVTETLTITTTQRTDGFSESTRGRSYDLEKSADKASLAQDRYTDCHIGISNPGHVSVTLKPVWNNRNILLKTKLTIFNSNVKSVLLYGSETWKHTKALDSKLQGFVKTCLRQILRIRWPDTIWRRTQETNSRGLQGAEMAMGWAPYDGTQPASQDRHWTGTPNGRAGEAVQQRLGEEA